MTTLTLADYRLLPEIVLSNDEHHTLTRLAMAGLGHTANDADALLYELERAMVLPETSVPLDVVRMGCTVSFRTGNSVRTVQLVYPKEADIVAGKISVLTPVGTALIGLRAGQSISWRTRDGRRQALTVLSVLMRNSDDPVPPSAA